MGPLSKRRAWLTGLSCTFTHTLLARPARADERVPGPKILIVGGSQIAGAFGMWLGKALREDGYEFHRQARSASGLARPDFYNWPTLLEELLAEHDPDGVVVMFGGNDAQGLRMPKDHDTKWIRWGEDGWFPEYRKRVEAFAELIAPDDSRQLFWLGMPAMRSHKLDTRVKQINDVYRSVIDERESGFYFETRPVLADKGGRFIDHMTIGGEKVRIRAHDGVHLRGPGARRLIEFVKPWIEQHLRIVRTGPVREA